MVVFFNIAVMYYVGGEILNGRLFLVFNDVTWQLGHGKKEMKGIVCGHVCVLYTGGCVCPCMYVISN